MIAAIASKVKKIIETTEFIHDQIGGKPEVGIVLGTGLGALAKEIDVTDVLEYKDIPNFPVSTVESHSGKLIFGILGGKKVMAMQGRFHDAAIVKYKKGDLYFSWVYIRKSR